MTGDIFFTRYQVSSSLETGNPFHWYLISPQTSFEKVDLAFWNALQERHHFTVEVDVQEERCSLFSGTGTLTTAKNRLAHFSSWLYDPYDSLGTYQTQLEDTWVNRFEGRHLLLGEILNVQQESDFMNTLQRMYLQGYFDWDSPIDRQKKSTCKRCGHTHLMPTQCARCGSEQCLYCANCIQMGRVRSCEPYLKWDVHSVRNDDLVKDTYEWEGTLNHAQSKASDQLVAYVHAAERQDEVNECLVWAVCGAGKTEILYETIYQALRKKEKVLITSPRRDVILELEPRLKQAFPNTRLCVLHGESVHKYVAADLFLATTHQTLRFSTYFDVVIIDEEDAFPFHHDQMLPRAVHKAKKHGGRVIYMTATPTQAMQDRVKKGEIKHVSLTKRYHGYPLSVPRIRTVGKWRTAIYREDILTPLAEYTLHLLQHKRRGFLFLPYVRDLEQTRTYIETCILPFLAKNYSNRMGSSSVGLPSSFAVACVHSRHPARTEIVRKFRDQEIDLLLTTTILERGVTVAYSDVAVLGSDEPVFDTAALIQIAGRVGRKKEDPIGHVWFFPELRTNDQKKAIRQIKNWNASKG